MSERQGLLFIIVGPPGVGKNTLMNDAIQHFDNLHQLATVTTRVPRPTEQEGREHLFVTPDTFRQMVNSDQLLEWQEVHPGKFYGVPRASLEAMFARGEHRIADIDVLGATYIRSVYPRNVALIFVQPPSLEALEQRMKMRREKDIATRLTRVAMELTYVPLADHVIVNDHLETATQEFRAVIAAEMQRMLSGQPPEWRYTYDVVTIPVYGQEALYCDTPPHFPAAPVNDAQIPHHTALSTIRQSLDIVPSEAMLLRRKPNKGSFISPVHVSVTQQHPTKHVTFTYAYLLPERIHAGHEWTWRPIDDLALSGDILQRLEDHRQASPQET